MTIGPATYEPGWKWSEHVGKSTGAKSRAVEHIGMVASGRATSAMDDGRVIEMKAGDISISRLAMTAGWWEMSRMSPCISWAPNSMRRRNEEIKN